MHLMLIFVQLPSIKPLRRSLVVHYHVGINPSKWSVWKCRVKWKQLAALRIWLSLQQPNTFINKMVWRDSIVVLYPVLVWVCGKRFVWLHLVSFDFGSPKRRITTNTHILYRWLLPCPLWHQLKNDYNRLDSTYLFSIPIITHPPNNL